eukprot:CAMPEP_0175004228 /NCGR_PEP_ID=MMETSP0005-20121125/4651_1 /TAXON_ID=420556 /ORGANISM="Ochromonas sp., Strain CCMP1393" /LENGTH=491 /DNA_ID=CAMNT_0016259359 /DNA_START=77 /DNA_END=1552 /DNA_ORIENTATION=-
MPSRGAGDDKSSDPMMRDKKQLPLSSTAAVIPHFLLSILVLTPLWLAFILPFTLIVQLILYFMRLVSGKRKLSTEQQFPIVSVEMKAGTGDRAYDIIVYGATGFTGKMAALYLAKRYGSGSVRWAIAGRRMAALERVREELRGANKDLKDVPLIIADSSNLQSLMDMAKQTRCVVTTAGPFDKYGTFLVASCASQGTHYCDITGETDWVRKMVDRYDDVAKQSSSRIVSFCGHDCIPWDLLVLELSQRLKKKGDTIASISFYDEINSAPSGGTMATVFHALGNRVKYTSQLGFDPLLKSPSGTQSTNKLVSKTQSVLGYSSEFQAWVGPFVMAMVMANCVRRSNALNNYSSRLVYKEAAVYPSFMAGYVNFLGMVLLGTVLMCPPLSWLLRQTPLIPAPGQGPSEADMDAGFLKVTGLATGANGESVRGSLYFPTDPGYRDTARMLVEAGLALALESEKIRVGGGIWTPAACQGDVLMQRLLNTGSSLHVE